MGIDKIRDYADGVARDFDVSGDQYYYDNGQGCGTIWFTTLKEARAFIKQHGKISGYTSGLCEQCQCHYSYGTKAHAKYPSHACAQWKEDIKRGKV